MDQPDILKLKGGGALRRGRGGIWMVDKRVNGRRVRISTGCRDLEGATLFLQQRATRTVQRRLKRAFSAWWAYVELFNEARKRARKRKIEFTITVDDLHAILERSRGLCEVTGLVLLFDDEINDHSFRRKPHAPSLDRIDNRRGYVPGNVRLVCCAANYAMNEWGESILVDLCTAMVATGKIDARRVRTMVGVDTFGASGVSFLSDGQ